MANGLPPQLKTPAAITRLLGLLGYSNPEVSQALQDQFNLTPQQASELIERDGAELEEQKTTV